MVKKLGGTAEAGRYVLMGECVDSMGFHYHGLVVGVPTPLCTPNMAQRLLEPFKAYLICITQGLTKVLR